MNPFLDPSTLRKFLVTYFDLEELRTLCQDLGVDFDTLRGEGKEGKARELVSYLERRTRLGELALRLKELRPAGWAELGQPSPESLLEPTRAPETTEFIGRDAELAYFTEKLRTSHLAVIVGAPGVGKTALAAKLARSVSPDEKIFWHSFHKDEGADSIAWEAAEFLARNGQSGLWRMLQKVQQIGGQKPPASDLFSYLIQLVRGQGFLFCFDGFQFIEDDPQLISLMQQLRPEVAAGNLSLIITARRRPDFISTVEFNALEGLNLTDARNFLACHGLSLSDQIATDLYNLTRGNAQFLTLASAAIQGSKDPASLIAQLSQTDDIESYLMTQVYDGLTGPERDVMRALAILLGYPGTRDAIEAILDMGGVQPVLNKLHYRFLLSANQGAMDREYSQHAMLQAFYYGLIGKRDRRILHHRAAEYYENEEPDVLKAALHFQRAEEYTRAAQLATDNVWAIINRGQSRFLRQLFEAFTPRQLDRVEQAKVSMARGQVCAFLGDGSAARKSYEEALAQAGVVSDASEMGRLKAQICYGMGDVLQYEAPQEALTWLQRGLSELVGKDAVEQAALFIKVGTVQIALGNLAEAKTAIEKGLALVPPGPNQLRVSALINLGDIYSQQGEKGQAIKTYQDALVVSEQLNDHFRTLALLTNLGIDQANVSDWTAATTTLERARELAEQLGSVIDQVRIRNELGILYTQKGNYVQASALLIQAVAEARAHNLQQGLPYILSSLADLQIRQKEYQAASVSLTEAEKLAREVNAQYPLPEIYSNGALVRLTEDDTPTALGNARQAVKLAQELGLKLEEGKGWRVLGQVLLKQVEGEQAVNAFEESYKLLVDAGPYEIARTKTQWGIALMSRQNKAQGKKLLQEAQSTFQSLGAERELAEVNARLQDNS